MRIFTGPIAVLCMLLLAGVGWTAAFHYSGNVGSRTAVQMELTRRGSSLTGSYWYDSIGNPLQLRGTLHIGRVTVWEFTESGRHTGTFTGRLSNGDRRFTGIWRSFDGRRSLPFSFTAVAEYRTRTVRGTRYVLTGTYPYFLSNASGWQALNRLLSEEVRLAQRRFVRENTRNIPRWDIDFTQNYRIGVAYADNSLASLLITEDFYAGGAHPGLVYRSGNYLIERSRPRLLSQRDLFDPRTNYQLGLFNIVRENLSRQKWARGIPAQFPRGFSPNDLNVYTLSPRSITFVFSPYVAGAYAEGAYFVDIPYSNIMQYINYSGPLVRFVR